LAWVQTAQLWRSLGHHDGQGRFRRLGHRKTRRI